MNTEEPTMIAPELPKFQVTIPDEILLRKKAAEELASEITTVPATPKDQEDCLAAMGLIKGLLTACEKTRKAIAAPVDAVKAHIQKVAKGFSDGLQLQYDRLQGLATTYQTALNRRIEAERQKEIADMAKEAAEATDPDAMRDRAMRLAEISQKPMVAGGSSRKVQDFTVVDVHALYAARPDLVDLVPKRREIGVALELLAGKPLPGVVNSEVVKVHAKAVL